MRLTLSEQTNTIAGELLLGLINVIIGATSIEDFDNWSGGVENGNIAVLEIDTSAFSRDDFETCVDLLCEQIIVELVAKDFKNYIMDAFDNKKPNEHLLSLLNKTFKLKANNNE